LSVKVKLEEAGKISYVEQNHN